MSKPATIPSAASQGFSPLMLALCVGATALLARLLYVQFFSTPMPYWDQWDGEGANVIKPWVDGTLQWRMLVVPHNEHRILPTRLVALASYLITGQWNNVFEARVGAVIFCTIPALLVWHALRDMGAAAGRWLLLPLAVLLSVLPFAWENFLVGFQTQFYALILSSVVAIALVARHHQSVLALIAAGALSVFASVTMASGMLTAVAVGATCMLAIVCLPGRRTPAVCATVALAIIAVAAYVLLPVIPANSAMRAQNLGEFVHAASRTLAWPTRSSGLVFIVWLPSVAMGIRMLAQRRATRTDMVMAGICMWSALQALAIAYGRGHGMSAPMSRYTELFVPGLFGNAWFALRWWGLMPAKSRARTVVRAVAVLFALLVTTALFGRIAKDVGRIQEFSAARRLQQENVLRYLGTGDPAALQVGAFELPYPDAQRLKDYLDDPAIRQALPVGR